MCTPVFVRVELIDFVKILPNSTKSVQAKKTYQK